MKLVEDVYLISVYSFVYVSTLENNNKIGICVCYENIFFLLSNDFYETLLWISK